MDPQFVLASRSPRRRELLQQVGLRFRVLPADVPEAQRPDESPADYASRVALDKARAVAAACGPALPVLGADTDVVLDGRVLGKPASRAQGIEMLLELAGRRHEVCSAIAVVQGDRAETRVNRTEVEFGPVSADQAAAYWDSGEPADKAGGYGIQGRAAQFVRAIHGSYSGVVGLPLYETCVLLRRFGVEALVVADARPGAGAGSA